MAERPTPNEPRGIVLARRALGLAVSLVALPSCCLCRGPSAVGAPVCEACASAISGSPGGLTTVRGVERCWSATDYVGAPQRLVSALKFGGRLALARVAAGEIVRSAPPLLLDGTLVPVPAAAVRRRRRGFDPAEALAVALASELGLAAVDGLRRGPGPRQVGRSRESRVEDPPRIGARGPAPPHALLVDDVTTTGATLAACARALRAAGAERVDAVTFSRTPPG